LGDKKQKYSKHKTQQNNTTWESFELKYYSHTEKIPLQNKIFYNYKKKKCSALT
jgi:hypothetical protein